MSTITGKEHDLLFVEVFVKHVYAFEYNETSGRSLDGRTPKELVKEFFVDYDINKSHTSRDVHEVDGAKIVKKIRITTEGIPEDFSFIPKKLKQKKFEYKP